MGRREQRAGGERIELCCGINDKRPARTGASSAAEITALPPRTQITWAGSRPRQEVNFWYTAEERDWLDVHHALVNLRYLPREQFAA